MDIKNNKGITMVDISISIMIIFLFSSLITGLLYNYSTSTKYIQRKAEATYQAVNIIETLKTIDYSIIRDEIPVDIEIGKTADNGIIRKEDNLFKLDITTLNNLFNTNLVISNGYLVEIQFKKYNKIAGNEDKKDRIIIATVKVNYTVGKNPQTVELTTLLVGGMA